MVIINDDDYIKFSIPKKKYAWVDNNIVNECPNCQRAFTISLRQHHCRLCCKIFCHDCAKYYMALPQHILSDDSKRGTLLELVSTIKQTKKRVCVGCKLLLERVNKVQHTLNKFEPKQLRIKSLLRMQESKRNNTINRNASEFCLLTLIEIQYKLPIDTYNDFEKKLLWANVRQLVKHNKMLLSLFKICKDDVELNKIVKMCEYAKTPTTPTTPTTLCTHLKCYTQCQLGLTSIDAVNLLMYCYNNKKSDLAKTIALKYLKCDDDEFKCYIPMLVYQIRNDTGLLIDYLITRCTGNFELLTHLYWEIQLYETNEYNTKIYSNMFNKLTKFYAKDDNGYSITNLLKGSAFIESIKKIGKTVCVEEDVANIANTTEINNINYKDLHDVVYPLNPTKKIKKICLNKIKIKMSITKPIIIPCITTTKETTRLMYKKDNLRKDQIVMNIIKLIDVILKKEGLDMDIVTYNILPIDKKCGVVEIVDDADTIYFIREKIKSSILNYILEKNGDMKIEEVRSRFIKSTAAYSVITHLLGIGDRHLDNIMVTRDGRLFHIDFGFILGKDPVFNNPNIRITPDIIDAMGGLSSVYYKEFTQLSTKIYNCLRKNISIFMNMLLFLPKISDINLTEDEIRQQLLQRFAPGQNDIEAKFTLVKKMEMDGYTNKFKDWCHYHTKEKTINSAVSMFSSAVQSLTGLWYSTIYRCNTDTDTDDKNNLP